MSELFHLAQSAVIQAGAGTGKTHSLITLCLHLLAGIGRAEPLAPARLWAVTFTEKAAAELKGRLRERIDRLTALEDPAEVALLEPELSLSPALPGAAHWRRVRRDLGLSQIGTIHGLCGQLLRRHAAAAGVDPNFSMLDENDARRFLAEACENATLEALEGRAGPEREQAARRLCAELNFRGGGRFGRGLAEELAALLSSLGESGRRVSELFTATTGLSARSAAAGDERARAELAFAIDALDFAARAAGGKRGPSVTAQRALDAVAHFRRVGSAALAGTAPGELANAWAALRPTTAQLRKGSGPVAEAAGKAKDALEALLEADAQVRSSALALDLSLLADGALDRYRERKRRSVALDFDDLTRLTRDLLARDLAVRRGEKARLGVLLVDEFQDTSRAQLELFGWLVEGTASEGRAPAGSGLPGAQPVARGALVVVGDRKQSIYAFRGAEVSVFAQLAAELAGAPAAEQLELRGVLPSSAPVAEFHTLTANYRSTRAILETVNAVASADFCERPERAFEIRYTPAEALVLPPSAELQPSGTVTIVEDDGAAPEDPNAPALLRQAEGTLRSAFAAAGLCARVARAGTRFSDIALLARRRSTLPLLELALDRLNIPFVVAGRALYATPEVRDLFAALRLQIDAGDRHALAVLARGPLGGLSDRALAELSTPRRGLDPARDWSAARLSDPAEHEALNTLQSRLLELGQVAPRLSPRDALALIADRFQLEALYALLPRGRTRFGNVERLLEIAARQGGSLQSFVRWLQRQIDLEIDEAEAAVFSDEDDAVRLLTIHGSKGLAFPTTIVLDTGSCERPNSAPIGLLRGEHETSLVIRHVTEAGSLATPLSRRASDDAQARARAERQRLSYVALTRARTHLAIILPSGKLRADSLAASVVNCAARLDEIEGVTRLAAHSLFDEPPFETAPSDSAPVPPPERPARPRVTLATIGVTALSDFAICARRFELGHLFNIAEPRIGPARVTPNREDPRALGSAAHRVLEAFPNERWGTPVPPAEILEALGREGLDSDAESSAGTARGIAQFLAGAYARSVREDGSRIQRELALGIPFRSEPAAQAMPAEAPTRSRGRRVAPGQLELFALRPRTSAPDPDLLSATIVLKATLDLVIERADGSIDVIDYKRSRGGDEDRYSFQLAAYREAAQRHYGTERVRTGLVHLLGDNNEPDWQSPPTFDFFELGTRLVEARFHDLWPGIPEHACRKAQCGFVSACYAAPSKRS